MMRIIPLPDVELSVYDAGQGEPIVFVHGFPLDHTMWSAQLTEFESTHRVIAPDMRGFGQSEVSAGTVTMETFADDLAGILEHLQISQPVTLCGLSMGGYIAWQFWKRHPERLGRLILCDTRALADPPDARQNRLQTAQRVLDEGPGFLAESMPERLFSTHTHHAHPELIESTRKAILGNAPAGIAAALLGMADRPDVTDWLPQITQPTLVVVGEEDSVSPVEEMRGIAQAIPGAKFAVVSDAGHMSPQEQPAAVNATIREFLK